jgi:hypothetical protein
MIDAHVLHLEDENKQWWDECEKSLVGHPITVYNCDGIIGNVQEARRLAYLKGNSPYVSFVDPDDIVIPDSFQLCLDELESNKGICGVYTRSQAIDEKGQIIYNHVTDRPFREFSIELIKKNPVEIHQLLVMRRDYVEEYYTNIHPYIPKSDYEFLMYAHLAIMKPWKALNFIGYKWRIHENGLHLKPHLKSKEVYDYLQRLLDKKE